MTLVRTQYPPSPNAVGFSTSVRPDIPLQVVSQTNTMTYKHNAFLDASASEESDNDQGYDSEAAEQSKGRGSTRISERAPKRRKLSDVESGSNADDVVLAINDIAPVPTAQPTSST